MAAVRVALADLRYPATPEGSVVAAERAIAEAGAAGAALVCFPEGYVPGYRIDRVTPWTRSIAIQSRQSCCSRPKA